MSIRSDIKLVEQINTTLSVAEKIHEIETRHTLEHNSSVDTDYQTVLEMISIYKDILKSRPFVKVVGQNSKEAIDPELFDSIESYNSETITQKLKSIKENIIEQYLDMASSIENKYKRSSLVIMKYGYDNRQPLLPQIKSRISSFQHPTSLLNSNFDTSKINSVRQGFNNLDNNAVKYKS